MSRRPMTWPEWCAYAESTPATPDQVGTVAGHMERLGYTDRAERLAVTARLLGLAELGSTRDLTLGQAGRLCRLLPGVRDRAELDTAVANEDQADEDQADTADRAGEPAGMTLAEAIRQAILAWLAIRGDLSRIASAQRGADVAGLAPGRDKAGPRMLADG